MRRVLLAGLLAATAANAQTSGDSRENRIGYNKSFNILANLCSESFGFTRLPKKSDAALVDKMEAHLLLASSPDLVFMQWNNILNDFLAMERAKRDDALANRLADAIIAAQKDPDSYPRAEALWMETMRGPMQTMLGACRAATEDPFIGTNYLSGDGSAERYDDQSKKGFAEAVKGTK